MGKPKKSAQTAVKEVAVKKVELLGKKVQYIGVLGAKFTCPTCTTSFKKGMVSEYNGTFYCSEGCIKK